MNNRLLRVTAAISVIALLGVGVAGMAAAQSVDDVAISDQPQTQNIDNVVLPDASNTNYTIDVQPDAAANYGGATITASAVNNVTIDNSPSATGYVGSPDFNVTVTGTSPTVDITVSNIDTSGLTSEQSGSHTLQVGDNTSASVVATPSVGFQYISPGQDRIVQDGGTLYIDERGINTNAGVFAGVSSGQFLQDGTPLNIDNGVIQDQSTGPYTNTNPTPDRTIDIQEPEITDVRIIDLNTNERLSRGDERVETTDSGNPNVQVAVRYNFFDSSFIDFEVQEDGLEVTSRYNPTATDRGQNLGGQVTGADGKSYDAVFNLVMDDSGQFEIVASAEDEVNTAGTTGGNRDVGFADGVSQTVVLEMVDEDDVDLNLDQADAFQGEEVQYDVEGLNEGEYVGLTLETDDLRDDTVAGIVEVGNEVFDPVADGVENGHILRAQVANPGPTAGVNAGDYLILDGANNLYTVNGANNVVDTGADPSDAAAVSLIQSGAVAPEFVYGVVERDGTSVSQLDTTFLDDTGVDIDAYGTALSVNAAREQIFSGTDEIAEDEDEESLNVQEAEITIDSPPRTYVPGQDVDLNGTTSDGVDDVAVFVRDRDNYYHVVNISVDQTNDEYEETDFKLSDTTDTQTATAADILGKPGVYRYGVIDQFDANLEQRRTGTGASAPDIYSDADSDDGLESSAFNSGASTQRSIRVSEPSLDAEFLTYNGEIFRPDGIDYEGELIGPRDYVVLFTGSRGNTFGQTDQADRNGEIEEDFDLSNVRSGNVQAAILSAGRDEVFGDGVFSVTDDVAQALPGINPNDANLEANDRNLIRLLQVGDNTQTQTRELLLSETVEEAASDDLISADEFRLSTDSRTQIEDVAPASIADNVTGITGIEVGETMVVRGTTNRNPEDATVVVEAVEGPSIAELGTAVTDEWETDGVWSVEIEVPEEVEPGNYTIQSDDGERVDEVNVNIVAEGTFSDGERLQDQVGELRERIEELEGQVDQLESERSDLEQQVSDLESENSDLEAQLEDAQSEEPEGNESDGGEEESQGQPGFTAVAALVALMAVALLALRREEE
jgi:major cell surface glycoprotein (TIGR04216 family)